MNGKLCDSECFPHWLTRVGKRTSILAANCTNSSCSWDRSLLEVRSADGRFCPSILICIYLKKESNQQSQRAGRLQVQFKGTLERMIILPQAKTSWNYLTCWNCKDNNMNFAALNSYWNNTKYVYNSWLICYNLSNNIASKHSGFLSKVEMPLWNNIKSLWISA